MKEREERNCKYIFSSIGSKRNQAQNALIRPRSTRRNLPRYHLFKKYIDRREDLFINIIDCYGNYQGEDIGELGEIRKSKYWDIDVKETR